MTSRVHVDAHALTVRVKQGEVETLLSPHSNKDFFVTQGQVLTVEEVVTGFSKTGTEEKDPPKVPLKKIEEKADETKSV